MANSISSSSVIISSAIEVLDDMLAPLGAFSLNVANEYAGRGTTVKVPLVQPDDSARDFSATGGSAGYEAGLDSDVSTVDITVTEAVKSFALSDNELYKSPVNLSNYVEANANAFGKFLLQKVKTAVEATSSTATKSATAVGLADIKKLVAKLDLAGTSPERHLVLSSQAHQNLLPTDSTVYGENSGVLQSGRVGRVYGMDVHPTSVLEQSNTASKCVAFATAKEGIAIVNRLPETNGQETLQAFETFTIPSIGLNVAYREHYNPATGQTVGNFTTLFGAKVGNPASIAWIKGS